MSHWNPYQPSEDGLPPEKVRFIELRTEPWPNQARRVRVHLEITPFLERPNIHITISRPDRREVSSIHMIEMIESRMVFTMHLKDDQGTGPYSLNARLYYSEIDTVDEMAVSFDLPEPERPPG